MHKKDSEIQGLCEEKMRMVVDMQELFCKEGETAPKVSTKCRSYLSVKCFICLINDKKLMGTALNFTWYD